MVIPPKYSVSRVVGTIKTNTSKVLREKFSFLDKAHWDDKRIWRKGSFVFHGGNKQRNNQKIGRVTKKGRYRTSGV